MSKFANLSLLLMASAFASIANGAPIAGTQDLRISPGDLPRLKQEALMGSGDAAFHLSQHYQLVALDEAEAARWLVIAAEDGNATAQFNYAYKLSKLKDAADQVRAVYWAKLVVKNNADAAAVDAAKKFLQEHTQQVMK